MKGYKAFNKDLTCIDYQYELDKTHIFNDEPELCVRGFHFCTELEDIINYYCSPDMRVFEIEADGIITDAEDDCSKRACSEIKLIKEIPLDEISKIIITSEYAYSWALNIGDKDIMINLITDSENAYYWALNIGNQDIMVNRINNSEYAYKWARDIGHRDIMIDKVIYSYHISLWLGKWPEDIQYFKNKKLIT